MNAFRKTVTGVLAIAAVSILSPTMASARGFHGGGFHGGGFHGGWGGAGLAVGAIGLGLGLAAAPYAYGGYGYPYYGYGYDSYAYDGGCYMVRRYTPWDLAWSKCATSLAVPLRSSPMPKSVTAGDGAALAASDHPNDKSRPQKGHEQGRGQLGLTSIV